MQKMIVSSARLYPSIPFVSLHVRYIQIPNFIEKALSFGRHNLRSVKSKLAM
jgi:hypothetical protein